ncbi:MarR family transcriptional regulator [Streptomyces sp. H27-G5]|uniref:MarR family transcriptional regulator n=1 Tax=Streptomyces sp. H27-G5 TaxID=2996698 RepID=UPI00226E9291|nr:MarR family transcriptional regulator [Streptomyces sp. H27-G5]MCY0924438.1 MarR family transcriptional regulator [Streptomyces sp. H27-G5]
MTAAMAEPMYLTAPELNALLRRTKGLQGANLRMLLYYATAVPVGEPVSLLQKEIADAVGVSQASGSRSVTKLVEAGWLAESYVAGHYKFYRLGPAALGAKNETVDPEEGTMGTVHHLRGPS